MRTKHVTTGATLKTEGEEAGQIEAVISTFGVRDRGGDVVRPSAFTDGQEIIMCWSHDWDRPVGKGVIAVETDRAVFKGAFWLDTDDGLQAYRKVKNAGSLQQYSWGFQVLDGEPGLQDGEPTFFIDRTEVFEASPVLIGEGLGTRTLSLKSLNNDETRLPLDEHTALVLAANAALSERLKSHADLKTQPTATRKEGRILSEANRERIRQHAESTRAIADDLDALHAATAPKDDGKAARALRGAALRQIAAITMLQETA